MPPDAKNHLCWRVVVRQLFDAYRRTRRPKVSDREFLDVIAEVFPGARLSEWRVVNGEWEKELDGLASRGNLEPSSKRPRSFAEKMKMGGNNTFQKRDTRT